MLSVTFPQSASGVSSFVVSDGMTRGPVVRMPSAAESTALKLWLDSPENQGFLRECFGKSSRFSQFQSVSVAVAGRLAYIRFKVKTGDAMGMNMISKVCVCVCVDACVREMVKCVMSCWSLRMCIVVVLFVTCSPFPLIPGCRVHTEDHTGEVLPYDGDCESEWQLLCGQEAVCHQLVSNSNQLAPPWLSVGTAVWRARSFSCSHFLSLMYFL